MLKAVNLSKTIDYQSPRDPAKGTPEATTFKLGAIPSRVYTQLKDKGTSFTQDSENPDSVKAAFSPNKIARDIVRFGLKGFDNFDELEFKTQKEKVGPALFDVVHDDVMDRLDIDTIRELSEEIKRLCEFDGEEIKNSVG